MKRLIVCLISGCMVFVLFSSGAAGDIVQVIPEDSLFALVIKNPMALQDSVFDVIARVAPGGAPRTDYLAKFLQDMNLRKRGGRGDADEAPETQIDLTGGMAVVMVDKPDFNNRKRPVAVIVRVKDYKKFLDELNEVAAAAAPGVTEDGTDVMKGEDETIFAGQLGGYAVVAQAEYIIKRIKAGQNKSLRGCAPFVKMFEANDIATYVNLDSMVETLQPQIKNIRSMMKRQQDRMKRMGMPNVDVQAAINDKMFDMVERFGGEVECVCTGAKVGKTAITSATHIVVKPNTQLAGFCSLVKAGPMRRLANFDAPSGMAIAWHLEPELLKKVGKAMESMIVEMAKAQGIDNLNDFLGAYRKLMATFGSDGAAAMSKPCGQDTHPLGLDYVWDIKPGSSIREATAVYLVESMKMQKKNPMMLDTTVEKAVATHRECTIDRITLEFRINEDALADMPEDMQMRMRQGIGQMTGMMTMALGSSKFVCHIAETEDSGLMTLGVIPTTDRIRSLIDRVLDKKAGTYPVSAAYLSAVKGLPKERAGVVVYSLSELAKSLLSPMAAKMAEAGLAPFPPSVPKAVQDIEFDTPSGIAFSFGPASDGIMLNMNVPMDELMNIRKVVNTVMMVMMVEQMGQREGGGR